MATDPLLDFDKLLSPISEGSPAGDPVTYMQREKFDDARKEYDAEDSPDGQAKSADWAGIERLAVETLTESSKDLMTAARLTEALVKRHGFAGLRDGICLMRRLVDECWDRLHPQIEDPEDIELRAAPFLWLDDADRGARFPNTVRMVPILTADGKTISWLDWKQLQGGEGRGGLSAEDFEKGVRQVSPEYCQTLAEDINGALEELHKLKTTLDARLEGDAAPGMTRLGESITACKQLVDSIVRRTVPGSSAESSDEAGGNLGGSVGGSAAMGSASGAAASRDEVYRQLANAATLLERLEPHSPIPYLIRRAVELGAMPFPKLIRELVRDATILETIHREFGLRDESSEE